MEREPGCLLCHCLQVFDPAESERALCACGHPAGRHDRYCRVEGCRNVVPVVRGSSAERCTRHRVP